MYDEFKLLSSISNQQLLWKLTINLQVFCVFSKDVKLKKDETTAKEQEIK